MRIERGKGTTGRRKTLHSCAVPFAYICFFAYLSGFAHFAFVRHGVCAEHGEVIHFDNSHSKAHAGDLRLWSSASEVAAVSQSAGSSSGAGHDHCILAHERRNQAKPSTAKVGLAPVSHLQPPARCAGCELKSLAVYELAPKTSPPA